MYIAAPRKSRIPDLAARRSYGLDFRVGRDIQQSAGALEAAAQHVILTDDHGADGVVSRGTGLDSQCEALAHVSQVGLRRSCLHLEIPEYQPSERT